MKKTSIVMIALSLVMVVTTGAAAYAPVIVTGIGAYVGHGSSAPQEYSTAFGAELDVDFRGAVGTQAYLAAWYSGDLWFPTDTLVPTDQQYVGAMIGGPVAATDVELRAATAVSTPLGDDQLKVSPDWGLSVTVPLATRLSLECDYSGLYNYEPDTDRGQIRNAADIAVKYDPAVEFGIRGGAGSYLTVFTDRFVLDNAGAPTGERRRDIGAEVALGAEGLVGYFTVWNADLTAGVIRSNANRFIASAATLDEGSANRAVAGVSGAVSSNPVRSLGIQLQLDLSGSYYPERSSLDAAGSVVAATTSSGAGQASLRLDWNPFSGLYFLGGLSGEYAVSNDAAMSGWNYTGNLGVQYRL